MFHGQIEAHQTNTHFIYALMNHTQLISSILNLTQEKHRDSLHLQNTLCLMNGERFHTIMPTILSTDNRL